MECTKIDAEYGAVTIVDSVAVSTETVTTSYEQLEEPLTEEKFIEVANEFTNNTVISQTVFEKSEKYSVDPFIVLALMKRESDFNPHTEYQGAYGLMQITPYSLYEYVDVKLGGSLSKLGVSEWGAYFDIRKNVEIGVFYLKTKLDKHGDIHLALMAYNGGDGYLKKLLKKNKTTTAYSRYVVETAALMKIGFI